VVATVEPVAGVHDAPVVPDASGVAFDPNGTLVHLDGLTTAVEVTVPVTSPYQSRVLPGVSVRRSVAVLSSTERAHWACMHGCGTSRPQVARQPPHMPLAFAVWI
jgi:hypothetical protein